MADINVVIKMQADQAIKAGDKLKTSLKDAERSSDQLSISIKNTSSAFKVFAGNLAAIGFAAAVRGVGRLASSLGEIGIESVKAASDAEETLNKFSVVFRDVSTQAESTAKTLADSFGLASSEAKALLADTGDLLTGFGFSGQAALDLSSQVQELAVDLASFTNFSGGAEGASQALTKALLGERESVKSLGISILEEDVKKQVAINTAKGLIFETERQAKAQATLDIALRQSANAIGDFERSQNSFANQSRILGAAIQDLQEQFGAKLLPVVTKVTSEIGKFAKSFDTTQISDFVGRGVVLVIEAMRALINAVNPVVTTFRFLGNSVLALQNVFQIGFGTIATVATSALSSVIKFAAGVVDLIPTSFLPESVQNEFTELRQSLVSTSEGLGTFAEASAELVEGDITDLGNAIDGIGNSFNNIVSEETLALVGEKLNELVVLTNQSENAMTSAVIDNSKKRSAAKVAETQLTKEQLDLQIRQRQTFLSTTATLAQSENKTLAAIGKAAAITQIAIKTPEAVASSFAFGSRIGGPPLGFAFGAIAATAMAAQAAKIAGLSFQDGGVVPGGNFSGDNVVAAVNSGEMILNRQQQNELFNIANGSGGGGGQVIQNNIVLELDGEVVTRAVSRSVANGTVLGQEGV